MKKPLLITLLLACGFLYGCGSSPSGSQPAETKAETSVETETMAMAETVAETEAALTFDGSDYSDTGSGQLYLVNESGSTENGDKILIYAGEDDWSTQIEYDVWDFEGSLLSYVFVDGRLSEKEQLKDAQRTLDLSGEMLEPGTHTIEVVQFENNDTAKAVVTYKREIYEVISKDEAATSESEGSGISVDKHLFSVEVTVPGIFFTEEEGVSPTQEELDALAEENGEGISYTLNEDGSVTCKMSKQKQKEMLDGFKQVVEDSFEEFTTEGSENYMASYRELKYNDDLSEFTLTVDPEQYGGYDPFYILVFEMYGYYYQVFAGVPEDDIHVYVYVVDSDGNVIETGDSDALF